MCRWFVYAYSLTNKLPVPLNVVTIFFRTMHNKTIIRFGFCDIQNNQCLGKGYQPPPSALADNPYLDLDYSGYHKNLIQYLFSVLPFRRGLGHSTYGPAQNWNRQCAPTAYLSMETWWIERQITDLFQEGKVKESSSPWSSPVVLVTKKDGSQRLCIDYHRSNAATVQGCLSQTASWWFTRCFRRLEMVFHIGSCFRLLASGSGREHPRNGSICNKRLVRMERDAIQAL